MMCVSPMIIAGKNFKFEVSNDCNNVHRIDQARMRDTISE